MNWLLGLAAVGGFIAGAFSAGAFGLQLRRDALGQDRHVSNTARESIVADLRLLLNEDQRRALQVGIFLVQPARDRDGHEFAEELRRVFSEAGLGSGGGGIRDVPSVGLAIAVDRDQLPGLDLSAIFRKANIRAKEIPNEPLQRSNYREAIKVIVTDKP
jgi:hypothetical protein